MTSDFESDSEPDFAQNTSNVPTSATPSRRAATYTRSNRHDHQPWRRERPRSDDPRLRPGYNTLDNVLDAFPSEFQRRREAMPAAVTYPCGVSLLHDRQRGCYRICFRPELPETEFKAFFSEHIKPLLIERHHLEDGPERRFYFQPATREWEMRYLFHARDAEGRDVIEDGKPKWVSCHRQVQAIAESVADQAATLLTQRLCQSGSTTDRCP